MVDTYRYLKDINEKIEAETDKNVSNKKDQEISTEDILRIIKLSSEISEEKRRIAMSKVRLLSVLALLIFIGFLFFLPVSIYIIFIMLMVTAIFLASWSIS